MKRSRSIRAWGDQDEDDVDEEDVDEGAAKVECDWIYKDMAIDPPDFILPTSPKAPSSTLDIHEACRELILDVHLLSP